jgi:hypothetical protein
MATNICIAFGLGYTDRWVQTGPDGKGLEAVFNIDSSLAIEQWIVPNDFPVDSSKIPSYFGGKPPGDQGCPVGRYEMRMYQDSSPSGNVHAIRQDAPGSSTWTSKNGRGPRYGGIRDPDAFYRREYHPVGDVTITPWCLRQR